MTTTETEKQLKRFIDKFDVPNQKLIRAVRKVLQKRFSTANELVYDNYNFFVIGYGPTEKPSDCFVSITAAANGVGLCFIYGARLPDPKKVLTGAGKQTRFMRVPCLEVLDRPEVKKLLSMAATQVRKPLPLEGAGRLIIRSISKKQRPRRKPRKSDH